MEKRKKIIWLPGWFPSRVDMLTGDFIERHAVAVSAYVDVVVLFVTKDETMDTDTEMEISEHEHLNYYIGYYKGKKGFLGKLRTGIQYYQLLFRLYKYARKKERFFDAVHIHIPIRQSLLALRLHYLHGKKLLVTEQNSWHINPKKPFAADSGWVKFLVKKVFSNADKVHVVSHELANVLTTSKLINKPCFVIPNVVNTSVFNYESVAVDAQLTTNFIAITGNTYIKNTDGIIRAFAPLAATYPCCLNIVGPNMEELKQLTQQLSIADKVVFHGAVHNNRVAELMKENDAMIFFTRFETFGCVMAEALCCGLPVIASAIPVLKENLTAGKNALFVPSENEAMLTDVLIQFIQTKNSFDKVAIATEAADKYNYEQVGRQIAALYD